MTERLEGVNSILEALRAGRRIQKIYMARGKTGGAVQEILQLAGQKGIPVVEVDKEFLRRMTGGAGHQGIAAEAAPYRYYELHDLLKEAADRGEPPFFVILDGIEDPQNLGAMLRTAECLGVHGVVIPKHQACQVTPAVIKASAGAAEYVKIARVSNLVQAMEELKKAGLWIVGTDASAVHSCYDFDYPRELAVVIGGEGRGMRRLIKEKCDFMVRIPLQGRVGSLNASAALAVVLSHVAARRQQADENR